MHRHRLEQLIAAYGADPARWPASERKHWIDSALLDPQLAARLDEERALDRQLAELAAVPTPSQALAARILAAAPRPARPRWRWSALLSELGGLRLAGPALACALSLGLGLALLLPTTPPSDDAVVEDWLSLALLDEGVDEELLP
jgi:anti-sigma factor RsiW